MAGTSSGILMLWHACCSAQPTAPVFTSLEVPTTAWSKYGVACKRELEFNSKTPSCVEWHSRSLQASWSFSVLKISNASRRQLLDICWATGAPSIDAPICRSIMNRYNLVQCISELTSSRFRVELSERSELLSPFSFGDEVDECVS